MNIIPELSRRQIKILYVATFVIIVLAVSCLCFCSHSYPQRLVYIDSLCDSLPERAKALLKSVPAKDIKTNADRMYYDLLKIKASNNLYEPQIDSTVFRVADYFENHGDKTKRRDAYYLLGKYFVEHNDAPQALKWFQTALDISDDDTPLAFKSKVYSQSGTLLFYQNLYDDALEMYEQSFKCDSMLKDTVNMIHGMRDIAQTYRYLEKPNKAVNILNRALNLSDAIHNDELRQGVILVLSSQYVSIGKAKEARELLLQYIHSMNVECYSPAYSILAKAYELEGKMDSSFCYDKKLMAIGTVYAKEEASRRLVAYYTETCDLDKIRYYIKRNKLYSDSIQKISVSESVATVHSLYNYNLKEREIARLNKNVNERTIFAVVSVFIVILLVLILFYITERNKQRCMRLELLNEHLKALCESLEKRKDNNEKIVNTETLCHSENSGKLYIYNLIHGRINNNKSLSLNDWKLIDKSMDIVYPKFKERLYSYCKVVDREYRICILLKLEFSLSDIATIMGRSNATITLIRSSLYQKFFHKKGKAKDFDTFVRSL